MSLQKIRLVFIFPLTQNVREATRCKFLEVESLLNVTLDMGAPPWRWGLSSSWELPGLCVILVVYVMEVAGSLHSLPSKHSQT